MWKRTEEKRTRILLLLSFLIIIKYNAIELLLYFWLNITENPYDFNTNVYIYSFIKKTKKTSTVLHMEIKLKHGFEKLLAYNSESDSIVISDSESLTTMTH